MSAFAQRAADLIGQTVDTYEIVEILGRGGMGVVYRAVDTSLDRVVALKMLHGHLVEDERFLLRFVAEAKALGRLQHPNIVNVYALRHVEPYLFLVMEYVDGGSLHELLERRGALPWTEALPIMRQALRGIAYAHGQGILHRDVKPSNLLLSRYGEVKLADLGLARIQETADQLGLTRTGFTGGTLHYMPPEQLEGLRHVDARGDLYALGMTFYKMLAGRTPFDAIESDFQIQKAIEAHDFPPVDRLVPDLPPPLVAAVSKATAHDPDDRFQQAEAMLAALDAFAARHLPGALPQPTTFPYRADTPVTYFGEEEVPPETSEEASPRPPEAAPPEAPPSTRPEPVALHQRPAPVAPPAPTRLPVPPAAPLPQAEPQPEPQAVAEPVADPEADPEAWPAARRRPWLVPVLGGGAVVLAAALALLVFGEPEPATLAVRTDPPGASVYLDQSLLGPAPLEYETTAGRHRLRVEREHYLPLDTTLALPPGSTPPMTFVLQRATAQAVITSEPSGAEVRLDGVLLGATPLRSLTLETGPHELVIRKHGYGDYETVLVVTAGRLAVASATLEAQPLFRTPRASVEITADDTVDVYVGGYLVAEDTTRFTERLPRGTHPVRVEHPVHGSLEQEVEVRDAAPQTVAFTFGEAEGE